MRTAADARIVRIGLVIALAASAGPRLVAQQDVVDIDVAVVDRGGRPVPGLTPDAFDVAIDGARRVVMSAEFSAAGEGRLFVLAIDAASFTAAESVGVAATVQGFVDRLQPNDRVAVYAYPGAEPRTQASGDRVEIRHALETLGGGGGDEQTGADPMARTAEGLLGALTSVAGVSGRKVVVLVCAAPAGGGPPSLSTNPNALFGRLVQTAAESNAVVYTLLLGGAFLEMTVPHKLDPTNPAPPPAQSDPALENWLAQVSSRSGGALIKVAGVSPEPAFDRIAAETSGSYRLRVAGGGLQHADAPHTLAVRTGQTGLVVRAPAWIFTPEPAARPGDGEPAAAPAPAEAEPTPAAVEPAAPAASVPLEAILGAYAQGEYGVVQDRLTNAPDLPKWIHGLRSAHPWPKQPRRAAVLAVEVAAVALATDDEPSIDEAARLLLQQTDAVRGAGGSDGFECGWYWAGLMLLENGYGAAGREFAARAVARCPGQARIVLADAVLTDQRAPVLRPAIRSGAAAKAEAAAHQRAIERYEAARAFPETELEARVREAWLLYRLRRLDDALALTDDLRPPAVEALPAGVPDPQDLLARYVRYVGHFVRGQILREQRQVDLAAEAYRQAIDIWPDAQTARVALMTLAATEGRRDEAETLAVAIERAPETATDPWWVFWQGDRPLYGTILARLRELAQ